MDGILWPPNDKIVLRDRQKEMNPEKNENLPGCADHMGSVAGIIFSNTVF